MRHLMLLRHAKTERDSASGQDRDRSLTARGRSDAPAIGRYVARQGLTPDLVLVSPAVRARETFELFASEQPKPPPAETIQGLYGADAAELLRTVRLADAFVHKRPANRLMLIGHNPGLHEFALALVDRGVPKDRDALADNLPTSGLALINIAIDDWSDLAFGAGELIRLVSPGTLRETLK